MDLLPLDQLGVHETSAGVVTFGVFFPGVGPAAKVHVRLIHGADQFLQDVRAHEVELEHQSHPLYDDYWTATLDIRNTDPVHSRSKWGSDGRYAYRYAIEADGRRIDSLADPFGREFSVGSMSAFTLGYRPERWKPDEKKWRTPRLHDLVIYELMLAEFANDLAEAVDRLPYLADLGINCIEVMPVSNAGPRVDWGFMPMGYFGVDERYGTRSDMHRFVQEAHAHGIAVIIDSVYDEIGHRLLRVVRLCLRIRRERAEVRGDEFHFYDDWWGHQRRGVLVFSRGRGAAMTVVALNFTDDHVGVPFTFPEAGRWRNGLDQEEIVTAPNEPRTLVIPSNYGQVWTLVEG